MLETFFPELETKSAKPELETKKIRNSYYKQKLKYNQELTRITQEVREKLKQDISKIDSSSIEIELDHKGLYITDSIYQKIKELNIDWFILIVGSEGAGKMLSIDTEVLLSNGEWKKAGDIRPGDKVLSPQPDGSCRIARIVRNDRLFMPDAFDVIELNNQKRKLYTCCGNHEIPLNVKNKKGEWIIRHYKAKDIYNLSYNFLKNSTHILMPPIEKFENREDPDVDPYILGLYIGDGYSAKNGAKMHKTPSKMTEYLESNDICSSRIDRRKPYLKNYYISVKSKLFSYLKNENLLAKKSGEKFIPKSALLSSISFRRKLLAGLIDTDGYMSKNGCYSITTKSEQLAKDIQFLVHTLGGRCKINEIMKRCQTFRTKRKYYTISFYLGKDIEQIPILNKKKKRKDNSYFYLSPNRVSIRVIPAEGREMCTCTIDKSESPSQWLIVRDSSGVCSVTHNSSLALNLFARFCQLSNYSIPDTLLRTLIYDEDELLRFISTLSPEEKYLPILLDEGANILFNRESMNVKRNYILKFFNVMRFLNSIMIICSPNIKFIDKNVKTHRVKSVFYIPQRGVYWYYDKQQLDVMLKNETTRTWKWIEPKIVGSYSVNKTLEEMTTLIKKSYVKMFSEKIKLYLETQDSNIKP